MGWLAIAAEMGGGGPLVLGGALAIAFGHACRTSQTGSARALPFALLLLATVQPLHLGAYRDLAWWFPLSLSVVVSTAGRSPRS